MRFKDLKAELTRLQRENRKMRAIMDKDRVLDEHRLDFNLLEIVVRPKRSPMVEYVMEDSCRIDLRVLGDSKTPAVCTYRTVSLSALDLMIRDKEQFIKGIGELMARELLQYGAERRMVWAKR